MQIMKFLFRFFRFFLYVNWKTLREVVDRINKQRLSGLSSEIAYNSILALFPALVALLAAIGLFEYLQSALYQLADPFTDVVPEGIQDLIQSFFSEITSNSNQGLFSLSFIASLWAFSSAISATMAALDQIHQVPSIQSRPFWKSKLVALGLSIGTIVLLISASALVFISDIIVKILARKSCLVDSLTQCQLMSLQNCHPAIVHHCDLAEQLLAVWQLWIWPITFGIVAVAFAFIYYWGPSRRLRGTPIMPGAILAAISWAGISRLFRLYVENFANYNRTYGAIGTVIILLLWLYLSALVMLIGAQLNVTVGRAMQRDRTQK